MKLSWRGVNLLFLVCSAQQFISDAHIAAFTPLLLHDLGLTEAEVAVWTGLLYAIMMAVAFSQRRKLLRHTLGRWLEAKGVGVGFDVQRRAEEVPVAEYLELARQVGAAATPL